MKPFISRMRSQNALVWATSAVIIGVMLTVILASAVQQVSATPTGVCSRTEQVRDAILAAVQTENCAAISELHQLSEITSLDLSGQGITSLKSGDFDGLTRLDTLKLSNNQITNVPHGIFDDLHLLTTLWLDNNRINSINANAFDQLYLLDEIKLEGNPSLTLADGMFPEFSNFAGTAANGTPPDNSGTVPRIRRYISNYGINSPEQFIDNLPSLYRQRFTILYQSRAAAQHHVSYQHPRIISWGADGSTIFAWNTDPNAPTKFLDSVEFLRQQRTGWTAGIVDFSGPTPVIATPASCQSCHGNTNKPMWGTFNRWEGTEYVYPEDSKYEKTSYSTRQHIQSTHPRISPLDFSASRFPLAEDWGQRKLGKLDDGDNFAVVEIGAVLARQHAKVLFHRLKDRADYHHIRRETICAASHRSAINHALAPFDLGDHNLSIMSDTGEQIQSNPTRIADKHYEFDSSATLGSAVVFLLTYDIWQEEPIVRRLYRSLSNADTVADDPERSVLLHYQSGQATAEDELIQKYRLHFGEGQNRALRQRNRQNSRATFIAPYSAHFFKGHLKETMPLVCQAITETAPTSLNVQLANGNADLQWEPPTNAANLAGYQIMRGVNGRTPTVYDTTNSADNTYRDQDPAPGSNRYSIRAVFDYYTGPESNPAYLTIGTAAAPVTEDTLAFTVTEGDAIVANLQATDADTPAEFLSWSIIDGTDKAHFLLTSAGHLTFAAAKNFEAPDDADANRTYEVTVQVSDGTNTANTAVSVTISNRNESPTASAGHDQIEVAGAATVILEGQGSDPDTGDDDNLVYQWTQTTGTSVSLLTATSPQSTFTAPTGLTQTEELRFTLRVTDGAGLSDDDEVSVYVEQSEPDALPPPLAPTGLQTTSDSKTQISLSWNEVEHAAKYRVEFQAEHQTAWTTASNSLVETRHTLTDLNCGTTYRLRLAAYGDGIITILDWGRSSEISIQATEACNAAPRFDNGSYSFSIIATAPTGTSVGIVVANDANPDDTVKYTITAGNEEAKFAINGDGGNITTRDALDFDQGSSYTLTVQAEDNNGATATVTVNITVTQTDEPAKPGPLTGFTLVDAADQTVLATLTNGFSVELADPDGGNYGIRADVDDNQTVGSIRILMTGTKTVARTENLTPYSLYGDRTASGTRKLDGGTLPTGTYTLLATAHAEQSLNGDKLGTLEISFSVSQANRVPEFDSATYSFSVAENVETGTIAGTTTATDADNDQLSYTIEAGNTDGKFTIDAGTGAITVVGTLDYETTPSYTLTVQADDGNGGTDTATVNIAVTDVDESTAGPLTGFTLVDASDQSVLATISDGDSVELADPSGGSYGIRADVDGEATIGSVRLELSGAKAVSRTENVAPYSLYGDGGANALSGESLPAGSYTITATAYSDSSLGGDELGTLEVSFTITEPNSAPEFGSSSYNFSVAEDASTAAAVGSVTATDADNDGLTYTIESGNGDGKFAIDGSSGAITVAGALDYESKQSYTLTVEADDGNGGTATAAVNISVTDVVEDPDGARDGAVSLGDQSPGRGRQFFNNKSLDRANGDTVDYYTFTTDGRYTLGLGVRDQSINLDCWLEDADGNTVIQSGPPEAPNKDQTIEWLKTTIDAGTYYIKVQAMEDGQTDYYLRFGLTAPED